MCSINELVNMLSKDNVVYFGVELKFVKAYYSPHQFVSPRNEFILHSILRFTIGQIRHLTMVMCLVHSWSKTELSS